MHPEHHSPTTRGLLCNAASGAAAGVIAATFVCPLDVIKTRFQVHGLPKLGSGSLKGSLIVGSLEQIVQREGVRGMYRGLSPTVLALLPNWAVYFTVYEQLKSVLYSNDRNELSVGANMIAAAGAGAATTIATNPLWVVKTRFQTQGLRVGVVPYRSTLTALRRIAHEEGIRGMYRGLSPTVLALLPNWAVYFTVYEQLKSVLYSNDRNELSVGANMIAAAGAGAATTIATNPLWVVKTRFQTQGLRVGVVPYRSTLTALRRIAHEEGIRGLYSGLVPALAGISHVAIQFPTYEKIKSYLAAQDNRTVDSLSAADVALASSISKIAASTMTYPHEVVRSRLQEQGFHSEVRYEGVVDCVKKVFQKEGVTGFYRGCATNLLRTTPAAVITFTSFEMIHRFLINLFPEPHPHPI
ncbi:hypothetical protein J5N97_014057 [Dioscorea zingiberensis]|uniref:Uncharacterized protein n=1 Tax=Dioscorea zingiberensis TaxID=325984 RepID=A0A9D5CSG3_9LILI|nr:hypothetical protein J5N97_014057 [Dioscorea zingiberensis]